MLGTVQKVGGAACFVYSFTFFLGAGLSGAARESQHIAVVDSKVIPY